MLNKIIFHNKNIDIHKILPKPIRENRVPKLTGFHNDILF